MSDRAARREARIRKILENSSTRLKKITNITEDFTGIQKNEISASNIEKYFAEETASCSTDGVAPLKLQESIIYETKPAKKVSIDESLKVIYEDDSRSNVLSESRLETSNSLSNSVMRYILIILLAVFTRHIILIASFINEMDTLVYYRLNNIFLPFFMFEIIDFTFFKPFVQHFNYLNVLHLFNLGLTSESVSNFIIAIQMLLQVMQDAMVYFFTFVCFGGIIDLISS